MTKRGYTLIELLVVVSIIGILTGIGVVAYNDFNQKQTLKGGALNVKNNLRFVQNKALAGEKPTGCSVLNGYGVNFPNNATYEFAAICGGILKPATSFPTLPNGVTFSPVPSPITFKVLGQGVGSAQTICLSGFARTYKISVTISGEIQDEGFIACP